MHFLLIISHDDKFAPSQDLVGEIVDWTQKHRRKGVLIDSHPLKPAGEAITVRMRGGKLQRKTGPFARSREKMCAYALIEADSIEDAVSVAAKHPMTKVATIEVRPVWDDLA
jgi:hypothetical protein